MGRMSMYIEYVDREAVLRMLDAKLQKAQTRVKDYAPERVAELIQGMKVAVKSMQLVPGPGRRSEDGD